MRGLRRRLAGESQRVPTAAEFRAGLQPWLATLPAGLVADHLFVTLPTNQPWFDTGLDLTPGDTVT